MAGLATARILGGISGFPLNNNTAANTSSNVDVGSTLNPLPTSRITTDTRNPNPSSNNQTSGRSNDIRVKERVPDIYGKVFSVPDVLALPYHITLGNIWREVTTYCVGRGDYSITSLKNGEFLFSDYTYLLSDIYQPFTSPKTNQGTVGLPFDIVVTGDLLETDDIDTTNSNFDISFQNLTAPNNPANPNFVAGPYLVFNSDNIMVTFATPFTSSSSYANPCTFQLTYQALNSSNSPTGVVYTENVSVTRTPNSFNYYTHRSNVPFDGPFQVGIRRSNNDSAHTRIATIGGLFGTVDSPAGYTFGNVSTIRVSRQLFDLITTPELGVISCQALRSQTTNPMKASSIIKDLAVDPNIGNRNILEIDTDSLDAAQLECETYFGTTLAGEFNYTFDDENISFEETINTVANAAFIKVYRDGPILRFEFDGPSETSKLLFNHRNKVPDSENRTISFGLLGENDGVRFDYQSIETGGFLDVELPSDGSSLNPITEGPVGITNRLQAYFHAHREFNRIKGRHTSVEFDATAEANLLSVGDVIHVADNTQPGTFDGEVLSKDGLELTLSQPYLFEQGPVATIHLQNVLGQVETVDITAGSQADKVVLTEDTVHPLSLLSSNFTKSVYEIVPLGQSKTRLFVVQEIGFIDKLLVSVKAYNESSVYYDNDKDFINNLVDINGN